MAGLTYLDGASVAGCKQLSFASAAAVPDRSDGVDDVSRLQTISARDPGIAGCTAVQCAALGKQLGSCGPVNCTVNTATAKQRRIGRVDDGVNAERGDVGNDDLEPRVTYLARGHNEGLRPRR